jgi:hypothetical protein
LTLRNNVRQKLFGGRASLRWQATSRSQRRKKCGVNEAVDMAGGLTAGVRARFAQADRYDLFAALLIAALLAFALLSFRDYAISNDEEVQHRYGELILSYYASGFTDLSLFQYKNLYLYGGLFDIVAVWLGRVLPADIFVIRHLLCALIGVGGIVATWATARLIAGPRAGAFAAAALAICGPWIGGMFNHTKDVPFAAAMIGAAYFLLRATRDLPNPRWRHTLGFGLLLGVALGLRAIALLMLFYALIAVASRIPRPVAAGSAAPFVVRSMLRFAPGCAIAYLIMIASWPWAALELFNPVRALFAFAHFHYPIKTLLAGTTYMMAEVPRWYVPTYLAIKLPLFVWFGAALGILFAFRPSEHRRKTLIIGLIASLPVLCEAIWHGPAFSGMRHFMFVLPPLAVLAGIGFDQALTFIETRHRTLRIAALAVIGAGLLYPASVLVRLHPYEYLFFNRLAGGLHGAAQRYDTDYWVNVMREAVTELETVIDRENRPPPRRRYFVAVCGEKLSFDHEAATRGRLQWATDDDPADFFIAPTHQNCDTAVDGKVVATISRLGVPIGVVKDRRHLTQPGLARGD